jgi:hypothetical protein
MSNAVYLIIAGALLGPIEAKFTTDPLREELTRCVGNFVGPQSEVSAWFHNRLAKCRAQLGAQEETTEQTCERAISEIGTPYTNDVWRIPKEPEKTLSQSTRILCIPAPSGVKL